MNPTTNEIQSIAILPELILSVAGIVVMLADPFLGAKSNRRPLGYLALAGTVAALFATAMQRSSPGASYFRVIQVDDFSVFFHFVIIAITAVVTLSSLDYLEQQRIRAGEYYALLLFGTVGMCLMTSARELLMLFIALEISSIATYVLAGFRLRSAASAESSLKYFLLGSFATAFFLYGVALIYGATGTTNIPAIAAKLAEGSTTGLTVMALALMIVGMAFKISAAPFHVWTPDVYEGAPIPVVALMSTGPKAAAFALMLRVLFGAFGSLNEWWMPLIWVAAVLSMTLGNIGALMQNNVKRMLAYSSIAHAGYVLVAFAAQKEAGVSAAIFYTATYAAMNVGAFAVASYQAGEGERYVSIDDFAGLGRRSPVLATTLTIFMLSLIGIPLTGGFFAKFYVFKAALASDMIWLTVIGVANSAIAAYYYLRLIVVMYMKEGDESTPLLPVPVSVATGLLVAAGLTLYLGILPESTLDFAIKGARQLLLIH
ncbi:MAG: NADH-quinone oxidoreductase subunit N [Acidobacteriales bacterium]|nr:NADH-quinone oxidoreductase subunit N [Terriglobales bacterium]